MAGRFLDGSTRFRLDGRDINLFAGASGFSGYSVIPEKSALKISQSVYRALRERGKPKGL